MAEYEGVQVVEAAALLRYVRAHALYQRVEKVELRLHLRSLAPRDVEGVLVIGELRQAELEARLLHVELEVVLQPFLRGDGAVRGEQTVALLRRRLFLAQLDHLRARRVYVAAQVFKLAAAVRDVLADVEIEDKRIGRVLPRKRRYASVVEQEGVPHLALVLDEVEAVVGVHEVDERELVFEHVGYLQAVLPREALLRLLDAANLPAQLLGAGERVRLIFREVVENRGERRAARRGAERERAEENYKKRRGLPKNSTLHALSPRLRREYMRWLLRSYYIISAKNLKRRRRVRWTQENTKSS